MCNTTTATISACATVDAPMADTHIADVSLAATGDAPITDGDADSDATDPEELGTPKKKKKLGERENYCVYCYRSVFKIVRHLERIHKEESDVKRFMSLPKKSEERRAITTKLRLAGNFQHNTRDERNKLVVAKRTGKEIDPKGFVPCTNCLGFYARGTLYRHRCKVVKSTSEGLKKKPGKVKEGVRLLLNKTRVISSRGSNILATLRDDEVGEAVKTDDVAVALLEYELQSGEGEKPQWQKHFRYKMRLLGRFILEARKLIPNAHSLRDILQRIYFDQIVAAAREIGQTEPNPTKPNSTGGHSVPVKVGFMLKNCMKVLLSESLVQAAVEEKQEIERDTKEKDIRKLLELYNLDWSKRVSTKCLQSARDARMHKPDALPTEEDFAKMCDGLAKRLKQRHEHLKKTKSPINWRMLAEVIQAYLIVFNGKRGGDVSMMKVIDYTSAMNCQQSLDDAVFASLSEEEKEYAGRHYLISVKGKRNRINSVILTEECKHAMDDLLDGRDNCGVSKENCYFFAIPGGFASFLLPSPILRKFILEFGVKNMSTRKIRKFMATVIQAAPGILPADHLARHMGHELTVHKEFYRQHTAAVERGKVSRLLHLLSKNRLLEGEAREGESVVPGSSSDSGSTSEDDPGPVVQKTRKRVSSQARRPAMSGLPGLGLGHCSEVDEPDLEGGARPRKKKAVRSFLTAEEKGDVLKFFKEEVKHQVVPGKARCEQFLTTHGSSQSWKVIKNCVHTAIGRVRKQ